MNTNTTISMQEVVTHLHGMVAKINIPQESIEGIIEDIIDTYRKRGKIETIKYLRDLAKPKITDEMQEMIEFMRTQGFSVTVTPIQSNAVVGLKEAKDALEAILMLRSIGLLS